MTLFKSFLKMTNSIQQFESHDIIIEVVKPNKEHDFQIESNHEFFVHYLLYI